jgi:O-antigen/teichoic acid export membrane protein
MATSNGETKPSAGRMLGQTSSMAVYGLSILMLKGFSLITIPLYARYLGPAEYGKLDIVVSVVEFIGLCASLGLADTLYRFSSSGNDTERAHAEGQVFGTGLIGALVIAAFVQLIVPFIHQFFGMTVGMLPLRAGLFAATITGLVELPLAWMRLHNHPLRYLSFVAGRSISQIALTWMMLRQGHGAAAILYATFAINLGSVVVFVTLSARACRVIFNTKGFANMAHYGLPLVGGGLAMYALGTFDRLFLAKAVTAQDIGHYAIAAKLALATALFVQPLALWWYPKRIAVLSELDGIARNAKVWNLGFTILIAGASFAALALPLFIEFGLPQGYRAAIGYLPWLILASVLNELVSLSSGGAYMRRGGYEILIVNSVAAVVALAGYLVLIPSFGVAGAIAATLAAHLVRLVIFVLRARKTAPVPLFTVASLLVALAALLPVLVALQGVSLALRLGLAFATPLLVVGYALMLGLVSVPKLVSVRLA